MPTRIERLQSELGVPRTGRWDGITEGALGAAGGRPDPASLLDAGYYRADEVFTEPWTDYLAGGEMPGSFGRDLRTSINQVPRWAWGTVAGIFSLAAVWAYRTDKKRERAGRK